MARWRASWILGLGATVLVGCVTKPEPKADEVRALAIPHVAVPQAWSMQANPAPVEAGWLATFGDPQLDALVAEALANNPDLAVAAARVEQADAQVDLATAQLKPAIGILGRAGSKPVSDLVAMLSGVMLRLTWEIDLWGRLRQSYRREIVIVALHHPASINGDLVRHQLTQPVDDRSLYLAHSATRVDNLAANVAGDPHLLDFHFLGDDVDAYLGNLGEVASAAEVERQAHPCTLKQLT